MTAGARRRRLERGQGLVDYAIVLAGIALVAAVALVFLRDGVSAGLELIAGVIDRATR